MTQSGESPPPENCLKPSSLEERAKRKPGFPRGVPRGRFAAAANANRLRRKQSLRVVYGPLRRLCGCKHRVWSSSSKAIRPSGAFAVSPVYGLFYGFTIASKTFRFSRFESVYCILCLFLQNSARVMSSRSTAPLINPFSCFTA
ncbi:hypothetical protein L596_014764 [Steinernema carpocapsae]|uniref:Uncharacterized protein n=1 Tax=Steinernema carpocapsae TaxID=34508 RepID=A0A4U5NDE5_STECR|nr:hypothetical protein L596_014764 [Steinernema carpocapsae]